MLELFDTNNLGNSKIFSPMVGDGLGSIVGDRVGLGVGSIFESTGDNVFVYGKIYQTPSNIWNCDL